jgi:hypothetical protein
MRRTIEIVTCDLCGREVNSVCKKELTGHGHVDFSYTLGVRQGGTCNQTKADLCCECTTEIKDMLHNLKNRNENKKT